MAINKWWITDEVRYSWKFVHSENRLRSPLRRQFGTLVESDYQRAYEAAIEGLQNAVKNSKRLALLVSPMLTCEEAYALARLAKEIDRNVVLAVGPIPTKGEDKVFPVGAKLGDKNAFVVSSEKAPNARGVRRVLETFSGNVLNFDDFLRALGHDSGKSDIGAAIITGNYPSDWAPSELLSSLGGKFAVVIDTLASRLSEQADVVIPGATWVEKAGTFENWKNVLQAFEQAIPVIEMAKAEGQIAMDLEAELHRDPVEVRDPMTMIVNTTVGQVAAGVTVAPRRARLFNAADIRGEMARSNPALNVFAGVTTPRPSEVTVTDMPMVEL
jgi:NADH-quinone oxidoreductase subunit G